MKRERRKKRKKRERRGRRGKREDQIVQFQSSHAGADDKNRTLIFALNSFAKGQKLKGIHTCI